MRKSTAVLGALVVILLLGGAALWAFLSGREGPTLPEVVDVQPDDPITSPERPGEIQHRSMSAFPFAPFQVEIDELRAATPRTPGGETWKDREHDYNKRIVDHKMTVQFEDVPVQTIVDHLIAECAKAGLTITDLDMPMPDYKMSLFRVNTDAFEVIAAIQDATKKDITYAPTEFGTCIGGEAAVQAWYMQSNQRRIEEHAKPELSSPILDGTFTIQVVKAHVGAIVAKMTADTGVEIIVGPKVWNLTERVDWDVSEPMKLREGLKKLARQLGGFIRVKGDRVFLIKL